MSTQTVQTPNESPRETVPIWVTQAIQHRLFPAWLGDTITRLLLEFGDRIDHNTVASVVIGAYRDLQCGEPALPELVERSARQRLPGQHRPHRPPC